MPTPTPRPERRSGHTPRADDWPEILKTQEVADYLRVSYETVLRLTHAGALNAIRVGREFRYLREEIDRHLRSPAGPRRGEDSETDRPDESEE